MLQFRLLGAGAKRRGGDRIHTRQTFTIAALTAQKLLTPVHGDEGLAHAHFFRRLHRQQNRATLAGHMHQIALFDQAARHVLNIHLHCRLGHMTKQFA